MSEPTAAEVEAEIAAAKVRLGYEPTGPAPSDLVVEELPEEFRQPFWRRQIERYMDANNLSFQGDD